MSDQILSAWGKSAASRKARLTDKKETPFRKIKDQEAFDDHFIALRVSCTSSRSAECLQRVEPLIARLKSFNAILSAVTQDPHIFAPVWGSFALIIELALKHQSTFNEVVDLATQIEQYLPQHQDYDKKIVEQGIPRQLEEALAKYYAELSGFYEDAVSYIRVTPLKNFLLLTRPSQKFEAVTRARLRRFEQTASWLSKEVGKSEERLDTSNSTQLAPSRHEDSLHGHVYSSITTGGNSSNLIGDLYHQEHHHYYSGDIQLAPQQLEEHKRVVQLLQSRSISVMALTLPYRDFPFSRNTTFHFRERLLGDITSCLLPDTKTIELRSVGLHGLGGVGKTQLALEYCYRNAQRYDAIFWIQAETVAKLTESYCAYARVVSQDSGTPAKEHAQLREDFKKWLMNGQALEPSPRPVKWLMVLDNVSSVSMLEPFWPSGSHGSIILTTRDPEVARSYGSQCLQVPVFTRKESLRFMFDINPVVEETEDKDREALSIIADRLGDLPLVLDQIGRYVSGTSSSYQTFLQHYLDFDRRLLFNNPHANPLPIHQSSVNTTWTIQLSQMNSDARGLMEALVLLDPDGVPLEMFEACNASDKLFNGPADDFPNLGTLLQDAFKDRQQLDPAILVLLSGSLVARNPRADRLSCHRIVREAVLQTLDKTTLVTRFDHAVFCLNAHFPTMDGGAALFDQWERCALYHNHLLALLQIYHRFEADLLPPILLCELIRRCAWYLSENGSFTGASDLLQAGCNILETAIIQGKYPGYYPRYICRLTSDLYNNFGNIEYERNQPGLGRRWFEKGIGHRKQLLNEGSYFGQAEDWDLHVISIMESNLALTYLDDGAADDSIVKSTLLVEKYPDHQNRSIWATNLALAYRVQGDLKTSLEWCHRAEEWTKTRAGSDSLVMAICLFNTATTQRLLKQDDYAFQSFEACLQIRQTKAPSHAYTGLTCHAMAVLMRDRGDLPSAAAMLRSAISILSVCESRVGAVIRAKFVLASVLARMQMDDEAKHLIREVVQGLESMDSEDRRGWDGHIESLDEKLLDTFVLFCHR